MIDWHEQLRQTMKDLKKRPNSAFLHNQAAVAYDALNMNSEFHREVLTAIRLEPTNPAHYYLAYAVYKRRGKIKDAEEILRKAVSVDSHNPFGLFELGYLNEKKAHWELAAFYYLASQKQLAVIGSNAENYIDFKRNYYPIGQVAAEVAEAIQRVCSHVGSKAQPVCQKKPSAPS